MYIKGYKVSYTYMSAATQITSSGEYWRAGRIITKFGIVGYYSEQKFFMLDFVHNGRMYQKRYDIPAPTERQVKLYANRFVKQIVNQ